MELMECHPQYTQVQTLLSVQPSRFNREYELLWLRVEAAERSHGGTLLVGGLYHPPNPCYEVSGLYDHSENSLERLLESNPGASVVMAGDFKKLDLAEVSARVGLLPLVSQPTLLFLPGPGLGAPLSSYLEVALYKFHR